MFSITFQPTADDLIAANRLNFTRSLKTKRILQSYALGATLSATIMALVAIFALEWGTA